MSTNAAINNEQTLKERYIALKESNPTIRARNAAEELGVSEGELLASRVGDDAIRLKDDIENILKAIEPFGEVMALTRNEDCVHERKGVYSNISFEAAGPKMKVGLAVNPDIDLRMFMSHWKFFFAATEQTRGGPKKSLQFFNKAGEAIHKIYLTNNSVESEYDKFVEAFKADEQPNFIVVEAYDAPRPEQPDEAIDVEGLKEAWRGLQDTHDFYPMLMKFRVGREQAHRLCGDEFAYELEHVAIREVLEKARDKGCEIMVFVGNKGCIQIHTGPVNKLLEHETWYNVMDPKFNLHLNETGVNNVWVTLKPTEDGVVTAVEVFAKNGDLMATFFGKRKPGIPELPLWREVVSELSRKA